LESLKTVLDPLAVLADLLSGESYITVSSVLPLIDHLQEICKLKADAPALVNRLNETVLTYLLPR
jgi:hypothetical protein